MLRYKTIQAFVAVWCAVCLSYAGARTAWKALLDQPDTVETKVDANMENKADTVQETETPDAAALEPSAPATEAPKKPEPEEVIVLGEDKTEEPAKAQETTQPAEPEKVEDPAPNTEGTSETNESMVEDTEGPSEEAEDAELVAEMVDIPSLSEYLSWFTCGSCRRNCSLDHPRCHNGSRLADLKAQEYYDTYGQ